MEEASIFFAFNLIFLFGPGFQVYYEIPNRGVTRHIDEGLEACLVHRVSPVLLKNVKCVNINTSIFVQLSSHCGLISPLINPHWVTGGQNDTIFHKNSKKKIFSMRCKLHISNILS